MAEAIVKKRLAVERVVDFIYCSLIIAGSWWLLTTDKLSIKAIKFSFQQVADPKKVSLVFPCEEERQIGELLSTEGVFGKNLFALNLAKLRAVILNRFPTIKDVDITRMLPHSLYLYIWLRDAVAQVPVNTKNSIKYILLDIDGVAFKYTSRPTGKLTTISVHLATNDKLSNIYRLGKPIEDINLKVSLYLLKLFRINSLPPPSEISIDSDSRIFIKTYDGLLIKLGWVYEIDEFAARIRLLYSIIAQFPELKQSAEYLDLRCLEAPIYKEKRARNHY